jgi:hypothetical protein
MTPYIAMTAYMMESLVLWGLVATTAMAAILQLSQGLGLSRMSLTFLMGSAFSGDRSVATILGFVLYIIGGWLFAFLYFLFFTSIGIYTWLVGSILGLSSFASSRCSRSSIPEWRRNTTASPISASLSRLAFWR